MTVEVPQEILEKLQLPNDIIENEELEEIIIEQVEATKKTLKEMKVLHQLSGNKLPPENPTRSRYTNLY